MGTINHQGVAALSFDRAGDVLTTVSSSDVQRWDVKVERDLAQEVGAARQPLEPQRITEIIRPMHTCIGRHRHLRRCLCFDSPGSSCGHGRCGGRSPRSNRLPPHRVSGKIVEFRCLEVQLRPDARGGVSHQHEEYAAAKPLTLTAVVTSDNPENLPPVSDALHLHVDGYDHGEPRVSHTEAVPAAYVSRLASQLWHSRRASLSRRAEAIPSSPRRAQAAP